MYMWDAACWVGFVKTCDGKKEPSAEWLAEGWVYASGGANKDQGAPHMDRGVCLLIIIVR